MPRKLSLTGSSHHWIKPLLIEKKIPLKEVALWINRDYAHTSKILSKTVRTTPKVEKRLKELAKEVRKYDR